MPGDLLQKVDYDNEYVAAVNDATVDIMRRRSRKASFLFVSLVSLSGFLLELASGVLLYEWLPFGARCVAELIYGQLALHHRNCIQNVLCTCFNLYRKTIAELAGSKLSCPGSIDGVHNFSREPTGLTKPERHFETESTRQELEGLTSIERHAHDLKGAYVDIIELALP